MKRVCTSINKKVKRGLELGFPIKIFILFPGILCEEKYEINGHIMQQKEFGFRSPNRITFKRIQKTIYEINEKIPFSFSLKSKDLTFCFQNVKHLKKILSDNMASFEGNLRISLYPCKVSKLIKF